MPDTIELSNRQEITVIRIRAFKTSDQPEIDAMIKEISTEFMTPIFDSNNSSKSDTVYDKYWVAFNEDEIIGTVALIKTQDENTVLKNMFVKKEYRGKELNVSHALLQEALNWCASENVDSVYLGTMNQFKAAHKFYEKNGFLKIQKSELPDRFIHNPLDDVFYRRVL